MDDQAKTDGSTLCNENGSSDVSSLDSKTNQSEELGEQKQVINEVFNSLKADATEGVNFQGKAHLVVGNLIVYGKEPPPGGSTQWKQSDKSEDNKQESEEEPREQKGFNEPKRTSNLWFDITMEMSLPRGILPQLDEDEFTRNVRDLQDNRLIFITCADEQMAKAAAYSLIERMDLPDSEQRRLLDFGRIGKDRSIPEIADLLQRDQAPIALAVVVDLFNPKADEFFDSLIESVVHSADPLWLDLRRSPIYLLCVVHAANFYRKLNAFEANDVFAHDRPFPHWKISFLQPLLRHHFPERYKELEAQILSRRSLWDRDERIFCHQLKALIQEGSLLRFLDKPSNVNDFPEPHALFKNEDFLIDTVLYAGTFFPDLKPREFHRVVNVLLGAKTKTFSVSTTRKNENGSNETIEVEREKLLTEIWQESTDRIKAECFLTTAPVSDGTTIVSFKSHQLREDLRDYLRAEYGFFLGNQFEQLMNAGLLFDSSTNITNNMVRLAAEAALADSDYLQEWFQNILDELPSVIGLSSISAASILQPLATLDPREAHVRFCQRLSALIRRMLEAHELKDAANEILDQLMRRQLFGKVLDIVRSLRFAADFDEFFWFKQLIERGHDECRERVGFYLADRMQNVGARTYQILRGMDPWVKVNPTPVLTRSGREALCLLIDFCVKNTIYFPRERYGAWPTSHPLFRFADATAATENLRLLTRWLFHPWMKTIIAARLTLPAVNYSIGVLIAEWTFILLRPPETTSAVTELQVADIALSPQQVVQILIQQVVESSDREQREALLLCWEAWSEDLMSEIDKMQFADAEGSTKIWKRNLLNDLIAQFKTCVFDREMLQLAQG